MKQMKKSVFKWLVVALACLLFGFWLGFFKQGLLQDSLESAQENVKFLTSENMQLSKQLAIIDASQIMDKQTIKGLTQENKVLNEQLNSAANKLYFYERVVAPELLSSGAQVYSFSIVQNAIAGHWSYELTLTQAKKRSRYLKGKWALELSFFDNEQLTSISIGEISDNFNPVFNFKYFQTIKGDFRLSPEIKIDQVILKLKVAGKSNKQVEMRYNWQELIEKNKEPISEFSIDDNNV